MNNKKTSTKNVLVNGITSGAYTRGIFSFTYNGRQIEFGLRSSSPNYSFHHHFEMEDIEELYHKFPSFIPLFTKKEFNTWTRWGHHVEQGLYQLITQGKLQLVGKNDEGEMERRTLEWLGEPWRR